MKTVIEMAREAGIDEWWDSGAEWRETFNEHIQAFAELVRADEREAAEERVVDLFTEMETPYLPDIAAAIRARGEALIRSNT